MALVQLIPKKSVYFESIKYGRPATTSAMRSDSERANSYCASIILFHACRLVIVL
jgi:hypothetical protein